MTCPPTLAIATQAQEDTCRRELAGIRFHRVEPGCGFSYVFGAYCFGQVLISLDREGREVAHLIPTAGSAYTVSGAAWSEYLELTNEH